MLAWVQQSGQALAAVGRLGDGPVALLAKATQLDSSAHADSQVSQHMQVELVSISPCWCTLCLLVLAHEAVSNNAPQN